MAQTYIIELPDGSSRVVEELPAADSGLIVYRDGGPSIGRVRVAAGTGGEAKYFTQLGATIGRAVVEAVAPPVLVDTPAVTVDGQMSSTATPDQVLRCTSGNWQGEPTSYGWEWRRDGAALGSTGAAYVVTANDAGHELDCIVSAENAAGSATAPPSNAVSVPAARAASRGAAKR